MPMSAGHRRVVACVQTQPGMHACVAREKHEHMSCCAAADMPRSVVQFHGGVQGYAGVCQSGVCGEVYQAAFQPVLELPCGDVVQLQGIARHPCK